jgi:RecB family exonuclease
MTVHVLWGTRQWAQAIAALPAGGPLPCRTALVPREAVAHALRRELVRLGAARALAGTRFVTPLGAALAVLEAADVSVEAGEEAVRAARVLALLRGDLGLAHFPLTLLRDRPGWDEAFARTIADLESTGLRPEDLDADGPPLRDVAAVWRALDAAAGTSWTAGRIYEEATRVLAAASAGRHAWPFPGSTLAPATAHATAAQTRFLRAIPDVTLALLAARPLRDHAVARIAALLGDEAARALRASSPPRAATSERDLLASYLFESPAVLADPGRPRSAGPDGSVRLEESAGVEEEIESAVAWVAEQVMAGVPLEDVAVLVPEIDPLAGLVAERLARLPWSDGPLPVHVAGGRALVDSAAGARALAVVRALRAGLSGDALADLLPALRLTGAEGHLTRGEAMELAWSLGTAGGHAAHPEGALEWSPRAGHREADLAAQLEAARAAGDDAEDAGLARGARELERLLANLRAARPAIDALVGVARAVIGGRPLAELWPALRTFLGEWLLQPGEGPRVHTLLEERLGQARAGTAWGDLRGDDALRVIEGALTTLRVRAGRFGEPAVYVGTVRGAVGLPFTAVRVVGLAEGHLPPMVREDPVLPDHLRAAFVALPTAADRALESLHALDAVVRDTTGAVALSAPRFDVDRSQREPSPVILEAAVALGRPHAITGEPAGVPDGAGLRRDAFVPARRQASAFRRATPLGESVWHDGVARGDLGVPSRWRGSPALDLDRVHALRRLDGPSPLDGVLGPAAALVPVPGLTADRPISPSALERLIGCPHRFLLERVLGFEEPVGAPSQREIGQPEYGALVHLAAETLYREHGPALSGREGTLADWQARADALLERVFETFLEHYPLTGGAVRRIERERLRRDVQDLLEYDWRGPARHFVDVERVFGVPAPAALTVGPRPVFVRGRIDRIDVDGAVTLIRDLKTGRPHPRLGDEAAPSPTLDLQIAVYGLVTAQLAGPWGLPPRVAAAYTYLGRGVGERSWRDDFHEALEPAAREWLALAAELLAARAFPRTPDPGDCTWCPFRPVCGDAVYERARSLIAGGDPLLARFGALKGVEPPGGD